MEPDERTSGHGRSEPAGTGSLEAALAHARSQAGASAATAGDGAGHRAAVDLPDGRRRPPT